MLRKKFKRDLLASLDPRCRIFAALFLLVIITRLNSPLLTALLCAASFALLLRELKTTLRRLAAIELFTALVCVTAPLSGSGFNEALLYGLRINSAALVVMVFVAPVELSPLAAGLTRIRVPAKLVSLLVLTYRAVYLLRAGLGRALLALKLRRGGERRPAPYAALFARAFAGAALRGEKAVLAMKLRGFTGVIPETAFLSWKLRDTIAIFIVICAGTMLILGDMGFLWRI